MYATGSGETEVETRATADTSNGGAIGYYQAIAGITVILNAQEKPVYKN